eukprot:COSAG01_NODE_31327_length_599_cov_2.090000_2_plen_38_part_01
MNFTPSLVLPLSTIAHIALLLLRPLLAHSAVTLAAHTL